MEFHGAYRAFGMNETANRLSPVPSTQPRPQPIAYVIRPHLPVVDLTVGSTSEREATGGSVATWETGVKVDRRAGPSGYQAYFSTELRCVATPHAGQTIGLQSRCYCMRRLIDLDERIVV